MNQPENTTEERPEVAVDHSDNPLNDYPNEPRLRDLPVTLFTLPRWILLALIRAYQMTLSKTLPSNTCRFYPSCSHYGYQAVYKYGALKGGWMAAWRVLRCNPFNPGGYDPVP
jgi:uncharacterized protein